VLSFIFIINTNMFHVSRLMLFMWTSNKKVHQLINLVKESVNNNFLYIHLIMHVYLIL